MALTRGTANKGTRSFIPIEFSLILQEQFDHIVTAMDCVNRDYEPELITGGDLVTVRGLGRIEWSTYTPDSTTMTYSTPTETSVDLCVDQFKYATFKFDDVDVAQMDFDAMEGYAERMAIGGKETVNQFLLTDMSAAVPVYNTLGGTTKGHVVEVHADNITDVLADLYTYLQRSKVFGITNERPWAIIPPEIRGELVKARKITHPTEMGDQVIRNGVIGECQGFELKVDTQSVLTNATGFNDDYFEVLVGVNCAYSFVQQVNTAESLRLESEAATGNRALMVYGGEAINAQGLGKLICKVQR